MKNRETIQLSFAAGFDAATAESALASLLDSAPGLQHSHLGRNLDGSWGAGDYTLDLFRDQTDEQAARELDDALQGLPDIARVDRAAYEIIGSGMREPELSDGIWRTLMLSVRPNVDPRQVEALERDLLRMPDYMQGIRNWSLGRVTSQSIWTHVWQQEYARLDDLLGEYLLHPFHWGWVDRWFDPEFPEWTVETSISHAFCPLESSLIGRQEPVTHDSSR